MIDGLLPTCVALPIFNFSMSVFASYTGWVFFMIFPTLLYYFVVFFLILADCFPVFFNILCLQVLAPGTGACLVQSPPAVSSWGEYCGG